MKKNSFNNLVTDEPITNSSEDIIGTSYYAKRFAEVLNSIPKVEKYNIALCGEWGSGKTSILNLTEKYLKKNIVFLRFSPWNITSQEGIIKEFFDLLENEIIVKNNKYKFKKLLREYSKLLISYSSSIPKGGVFLQPVFSFIGEQFSNRSLIDQKKEIVSFLSNKTNKKYYILIDDLDRMTENEVVFIFQMIKAIADFPSVSYILSFDKTVVSNLLLEAQKCDGEFYLKKFFQIQWNVPSVSNDILYNLFESYLKKSSLPIFENPMELEYFKKAYTKCVSPFIKTIRDVKILYNSYLFYLTGIKEDVNLGDALVIACCNIFFSKIVPYMINNKLLLLGRDEEFYQSEMRRMIGKNDNEEAKFKIIRDYFQEETEIAKNILFFLFPLFAKFLDSSSNDEKNADSRYLIQSSASFNKYFTQKVEYDVITNKNIENVLFNWKFEEALQYMCSFISKNNVINDFLDIIEDKILATPNITDERKIMLFKLLMYVSEKIPGYCISSASFNYPLYRKVLELCFNILDRESEIEKFILPLLNQTDLLNCYKGICHILNAYSSRKKLFKEKHPNIKNGVKKLSIVAIDILNKNYKNIEIIDDMLRVEPLLLYHENNPKKLQELYGEKFYNPEIFLKFIFAFSGIWFTQTGDESFINDLWKKEFPEIIALQDNKRRMEDLFKNNIYQKLNDVEREDLARYSSNFKLLNGGKHSHIDIKFEWNKKYL